MKFKPGDEVIVIDPSYPKGIDDGAIGHIVRFKGIGPFTRSSYYEVEFGEPFGVVAILENEMELLSIVKSPLYKALL